VIAHMSYVMCDRCGNPADCADDAKEARKLAKAQGYVRLGANRNGEDLCRQCAQKEGIGREPEPEPEGWLCPACGSMMYEARLLKGYPKTGPESKRRTCALHGPSGQFRHIATDRKAKNVVS